MTTAIRSVIGPHRPSRSRPIRAKAHVIVFDQPRRCDIGVDHSIDAYQQSHDYGRVLAELPAHWDQDQRRAVKWCIMAVPRDQVAATVRAAQQRLRE
jgi:hypothetical protein